jgi:hypothetical protein
MGGVAGWRLAAAVSRRHARHDWDRLSGCRLDRPGVRGRRGRADRHRVHHLAQGTEAGGHGGGRSLLPSSQPWWTWWRPSPWSRPVASSMAAVSAAALALGAAGVLIGSRFYAAEESLAAPAWRERLVQGSGDGTRATAAVARRDYRTGAPEPVHRSLASGRARIERGSGSGAARLRGSRGVGRLRYRRGLGRRRGRSHPRRGTRG